MSRSGQTAGGPGRGKAGETDAGGLDYLLALLDGRGDVLHASILADFLQQRQFHIVRPVLLAYLI